MHMVINKSITILVLQNLSRQYLRNRVTSDIDIVGYIDVI
jgi:hypothetical protein